MQIRKAPLCKLQKPNIHNLQRQLKFPFFFYQKKNIFLSFAPLLKQMCVIQRIFLWNPVKEGGIDADELSTKSYFLLTWFSSKESETT